MAKLNLTDLANLQNENTAVSAINSNNAAIETAIENTVSRDGTSPNQMNSDFDMNSHRITNLPVAVNATEPVRKSEFDQAVIGMIPNEQFHFTNTDESTSPTTGAVIIDGGLGVGKNINSGGDLGIAGSIEFNGAINNWTLPAVTDTVVGKATTDTLTNKSVNLANNTLTGTTAEFNTALSDNDFATQAGSETLTNKTINASNNSVSNLTTAMFAADVVDTDVNLTANSNTRLATQAATKSYADSRIAANDAMVYKGVLDASANPNYPAADAGHTYKVSVAGKVGGSSGVVVEVGDLVLCTVDGSASGNQATVGANWDVIQVNVDGAVTGPSSSTSANIATFNGTTGKIIQDSGKALPSGTVVGTSDSQTLTTKTFNTANNTFTLNGAAFGNATQATAALNVVVGDSGSGGTKGLVPAPAAGDAAAEKYLKADGTWDAPSAGGGGMTTIERQNFLLNSSYLSKALSGYRRGVQLFSTGFKGANDTANGISTGSSSNYTHSASNGNVVPSQNPTTFDTPTTSVSMGNYSIFSRTGSLPNSAVVTHIGFYATSAITFKGKIAKENSTTNYDVVVSESLSHPGGGWAYIALSSPYTVPASGTYRLGAFYNSGSVNATGLTVNTSIIAGDQAVASGITMTNVASNNMFGMGYITTTSYNNMTLTTVSTTTDGSVGNARVLIEIDNSGTFTADVDFSVEATCNGGSNWTSIPFALNSGTDGTKRMFETSNTACTAGTSYAVRFKTLTNKNVPIYSIAVQVS